MAVAFGRNDSGIVIPTLAQAGERDLGFERPFMIKHLLDFPGS